MTICIGALCNDKSHERYVVVVSDRMITLNLPSIEYEQKLSKTIQITPNCVVSTAGLALAFSDVLTAAKPSIDGLQRKDIAKIVETLRKSYVEIRNKKIEETLLEKIGLTTKEFYEKNQNLSRDVVNMVIDAMSKYNYGLILLIAGVDESGAHIYRIDNPGFVTIYDAIGYCAIGSGDIHAVSTFIANNYDPNLDLNHVVAMTYEAKKRSEKAQGVGQQSDLFIICDSNTMKLSDEQIKQLDEIYTKREEQERKAVSDIQTLIEKLNVVNTVRGN